MVLNHNGSLLFHAGVGFMLGVLISVFIHRLIRSRGWFKRHVSSGFLRIVFYLFRVTFYIGIIGLTTTIALVAGTNKIVDKEVSRLVQDGTAYCRDNYFQDYEFVEEAFSVYRQLYSSGKNINELNQRLAEGMAEAVSEKYGLGFLSTHFLKSPKKEMIQHLEEIEKGMVIILVSNGLEQIGAGDLIEPDQLDEAFYKWLHSDDEGNFGSVNEFISRQITAQIKPLAFSIWLPILSVCTLFIVLNLLEATIYYYRNKQSTT